MNWPEVDAETRQHVADALEAVVTRRPDKLHQTVADAFLAFSGVNLRDFESEFDAASRKQQLFETLDESGHPMSELSRQLLPLKTILASPQLLALNCQHKFMKHDEDRTGVLNLQQAYNSLMELAEDLCPEAMPSVESFGRWFAMLDQDDSGELDVGEFSCIVKYFITNVIDRAEVASGRLPKADTDELKQLLSDEARLRCLTHATYIKAAGHGDDTNTATSALQQVTGEVSRLVVPTQQQADRVLLMMRLRGRDIDGRLTEEALHEMVSIHLHSTWERSVIARGRVPASRLETIRLLLSNARELKHHVERSFHKYDADRSGEIEKEEAMLCLTDLAMVVCPDSIPDSEQFNFWWQMLGKADDGGLTFADFQSFVRDYLKYCHDKAVIHAGRLPKYMAELLSHLLKDATLFSEYCNESFNRQSNPTSHHLPRMQAYFALQDLAKRLCPDVLPDEESFASFWGMLHKGPKGQVDASDFRTLARHFFQTVVDRAEIYTARLPRRMLEYLRRQLADEARFVASCREDFSLFDVDGSGELDMEETWACLQALSARFCPDAVLSRSAFEVAFRVTDRDETGVLELTEFQDMVRSFLRNAIFQAETAAQQIPAVMTYYIQQVLTESEGSSIDNTLHSLCRSVFCQRRVELDHRTLTTIEHGAMTPTRNRTPSPLFLRDDDGAGHGEGVLGRSAALLCLQDIAQAISPNVVPTSDEFDLWWVQVEEQGGMAVNKRLSLDGLTMLAQMYLRNHIHRHEMRVWRLSPPLHSHVQTLLLKPGIMQRVTKCQLRAKLTKTESRTALQRLLHQLLQCPDLSEEEFDLYWSDSLTQQQVVPADMSHKASQLSPRRHTSFGVVSGARLLAGREEHRVEFGSLVERYLTDRLAVASIMEAQLTPALTRGLQSFLSFRRKRAFRRVCDSAFREYATGTSPPQLLSRAPSHHHHSCTSASSTQQQTEKLRLSPLLAYKALECVSNVLCPDRPPDPVAFHRWWSLIGKTHSSDDDLTKDSSISIGEFRELCRQYFLFVAEKSVISSFLIPPAMVEDLQRLIRKTELLEGLIDQIFHEFGQRQRSVPSHAPSSIGPYVYLTPTGVLKGLEMLCYRYVPHRRPTQEEVVHWLAFHSVDRADPSMPSPLRASFNRCRSLGGGGVKCEVDRDAFTAIIRDFIVALLERHASAEWRFPDSQIRYMSMQLGDDRKEHRQASCRPAFVRLAGSEPSAKLPREEAFDCVREVMDWGCFAVSVTQSEVRFWCHVLKVGEQLDLSQVEEVIHMITQTIIERAAISASRLSSHTQHLLSAAIEAAPLPSLSSSLRSAPGVKGGVTGGCTSMLRREVMDVFRAADVDRSNGLDSEEVLICLQDLVARLSECNEFRMQHETYRVFRMLMEKVHGVPRTAVLSVDGLSKMTDAFLRHVIDAAYICKGQLPKKMLSGLRRVSAKPQIFEPLVDDIFERFDIDDSGQLERHEGLCCLQALSRVICPTAPPSLEDYDRLWTMADGDDSGTLAKDEFAKLMRGFIDETIERAEIRTLKLPKLLLTYLEHVTSEEGIIELEKRAEAYFLDHQPQANEYGKIDRRVALRLLKSLAEKYTLGVTLTMDEVQHSWMQHDKDNDGTASLEEFNLMLQSILLSFTERATMADSRLPPRLIRAVQRLQLDDQLLETKAMAAFRAADKSGEGQLTKDEALKALKVLGSRFCADIAQFYGLLEDLMADMFPVSVDDRLNASQTISPSIRSSSPSPPPLPGRAVPSAAAGMVPRAIGAALISYDQFKRLLRSFLEVCVLRSEVANGIVSSRTFTLLQKLTARRSPAIFGEVCMGLSAAHDTDGSGLLDAHESLLALQDLSENICPEASLSLIDLMDLRQRVLHGRDGDEIDLAKFQLLVRELMATVVERARLMSADDEMKKDIMTAHTRKKGRQTKEMSMSSPPVPLRSDRPKRTR
ncbi:unnamed protein product [Vitrella brassicaformis CCMP3155]|uniref:EF-hand domain-containing protein n=3 Tax=Vitrella brassicaformis TaxID=1169539 RepID=A0A0G4EDG4_VITBC|nr:unnamed protein product [Vitrella brassicaformis CCMP3155]|eukprot:CEL93751.1 unnamed protein product [Vitrella brassicaformis CCMP3155]